MTPQTSLLSLSLFVIDGGRPSLDDDRFHEPRLADLAARLLRPLPRAADDVQRIVLHSLSARQHGQRA